MDHGGKLPEEMADESGTPTPEHQKLIELYRGKVTRFMIASSELRNYQFYRKEE